MCFESLIDMPVTCARVIFVLLQRAARFRPDAYIQRPSTGVFLDQDSWISNKVPITPSGVLNSRRALWSDKGKEGRGGHLITETCVSCL
jgi:hypothetical protein